jgi:hypothetical protein
MQGPRSIPNITKKKKKRKEKKKRDRETQKNREINKA